MANTTPLLLCNLYLDADGGGTQNFARKGITFHNVAFTGRILNFGYVERTIPSPPGMLQIDDAEIVVEDIDGQIREWFSLVTPFRRVGEIVFEQESDSNALTDRSLPISGWNANFTNNQPMADQYWVPLFTGEIVPGGCRFEVGRAYIRLREITSLWLDREIPKLITRDHFPNLPDDANEGATDYTAPIIFGIVQCYSAAHVVPEGAIKCRLIDTTAHLYCVARHECAQVYSVYRRKKGDARFFIVSNTEYEILTINYTIDTVVYPFTLIHFFLQQEDGTFIQCEANGINYKFDFATSTQITGITQRNPIASLLNLIYYLLQTEVNLQRFSKDSWVTAEAQADSLGYVMDGAITDTMTVGAAISKICEDFLIDFYQTNQDQLAVSIYNPNTDAFAQIDNKLIGKNSFKPNMPEVFYTRLRYRYARDNAGLIEFVKASHTGHFGFEETLLNLNDIAEIEITGKNGLIEKVVELDFVRDDDVALALMKVRIGYYNLRSYTVDFDLPIPEVIGWLQLALPIQVTHIQGIGPMGVGWANLAMRITSIIFDLKNYRAKVRAVRLVTVPDVELEASYTGAHPPRDTQKRIPPLPVLINGTDDGFGIVPTAVPQLNIIDMDVSGLSLTAPEIGSTFVASFTDGTTVTTESDSTHDAAIVGVKWLENPNIVPRVAGAYVIVPGGKTSLRVFVGTLSPDTRPLSLGTKDIYRVLFYSTDFDRLYWYVGTGGGGTTSGWRAINADDGNIVLRWDAPGVGYHICDGSTVNRSDYKGNVGSYVLPVLFPSATDNILELSVTPTNSLPDWHITDQTTEPSCLATSALVAKRVRLMPYMRL